MLARKLHLDPNDFETADFETSFSASAHPAARTTAGQATRQASSMAHVWKANQLGAGVPQGLSSGFVKLNAELPGGGWPTGCLTELITREAGVGELRLLVPMLRQLTRERKVVILLAPPHIPYAPALASFGIDLDYVIVIQAPNAADRLWAVEQTLKSNAFGVLLAWMPHDKTKPEHLRRLQLAAQSANGPVILFRQLPAQFQSSPAPLRLLLLPKHNQQISVQVLKRRGPVLSYPITLDLPQPVAAVGLKPSVRIERVVTPTEQPSRDKPMTYTHMRTQAISTTTALSIAQQAAAEKARLAAHSTH
jgi:protein ImuA